MVWDFYLDESYNDDRTLCVGGFVAPRDMWDAITNRWRERLAYENRQSTKKGFPPIRRYHATDCEGGNKEFHHTKGWPRDRRKLQTRRLCEIIGESGPCGIVVGGRIDEVINHIDPAQHNAKETLYDICFRMTLMDVRQVMNVRFPGALVRVIYDDSNYGNTVRRAFQRMKDESSIVAERFTELVPGNSVTDLELQAADFLAYEGFKLLNDAGKSNEEMRLWLRKLLGKKTPMQITRFTDENFKDLRKMIDNIKEGRTLDEGVTSKLEVSVEALQPVGLRVVRGTPLI